MDYMSTMQNTKKVLSKVEESEFPGHYLVLKSML